VGRPVYLHVNLGTSPAVAAVALAAFSVTMAAGRAAGSVPGLRPVWPAAAIAGFALLGAGLAGIFPQIVTVAARLDPEQAGRNIGRIAAVSSWSPRPWP
jgi:hypothetical protein